VSHTGYQLTQGGHFFGLDELYLRFLEPFEGFGELDVFQSMDLGFLFRALDLESDLHVLELGSVLGAEDLFLHLVEGLVMLESFVGVSRKLVGFGECLVGLIDLGFLSRILCRTKSLVEVLERFVGAPHLVVQTAEVEEARRFGPYVAELPADLERLQVAVERFVEIAPGLVDDTEIVERPRFARSAVGLLEDLEALRLVLQSAIVIPLVHDYVMHKKQIRLDGPQPITFRC